MPRAARVCSTPGCPNLTTGGRCDHCRREADQRRGTRQQRGYGKGHDRFRAGVLARNPYCVLCLAEGTVTSSTEADHWPLSRRELVTRCLDPNDPAHGRGLCKPHHSQETARHQPGGWHTPGEQPL